MAASGGRTNCCSLPGESLLLTPMMNGIQSEPASKAVYMSHLSSGVTERLPDRFVATFLKLR